MAQSPFLNLNGIGAILMILFVLCFVVWILGGLPFKILLIVGFLFLAAIFFAKQNPNDW